MYAVLEQSHATDDDEPRQPDPRDDELISAQHRRYLRLINSEQCHDNDA
jgi:hypothetical protein